MTTFPVISLRAAHKVNVGASKLEVLNTVSHAATILAADTPLTIHPTLTKAQIFSNGNRVQLAVNLPEYAMNMATGANCSSLISITTSNGLVTYKGSELDAPLGMTRTCAITGKQLIYTMDSTFSMAPGGVLTVTLDQAAHRGDHCII